MTHCWFECPTCKGETDLNWDTFSFAGKFRSVVKCGHCGENILISVSVIAAEHSAHPTLPTSGENSATWVIDPKNITPPAISG